MKTTPINLQDHIAVVTGGSRGIGRSVVRHLAQLGAHVVVNYVHDDAAAQESAQQGDKYGVTTQTLRADISVKEEADDLITRTFEKFGRIDILVCNAGIWKGAQVEKISEELWDNTININLKGTWLACRAVAPIMKHQRYGRIVIVSSTAGQRGEANVSNYAASKGGQIAFAKSLSTELAEFGITVNVVAPGWVDTDMNSLVFADVNYRRRIAQSIPLGRIASAAEVAQPIVFLCSDWARHITGAVLNVNGGSVL